jgi:hypothetical protein
VSCDWQSRLLRNSRCHPFLRPRNMSAAEIHRELCTVYGHNGMSEGTVRQWSRMVKDERTNVLEEERSGRPL